MAVGTLGAKVVLDRAQQTYCGSNEPVRGNVVLRYGPQHSSTTGSSELFGPLTITLVFHGRAKTKIYKNNGQNRRIYRGRAPLFSTSVTIHDGPLKAAPHQDYLFPFAVAFPTCAQAMANQGTWSSDGRFADGPGNVLPPSFSMSYSGFAHRFDTFTEYRIGANVSLAGIDVKIHQISEEAEALVLYEQPKIPLEMMSKQVSISKTHIKIQNEHLLPENERPSGFKEKTKALFRSDYYPEYHIDVILSVPVHVYLGSSMEFEISARPVVEMSTAPVIPDIKMGPFSVSIEAKTLVRAERVLLMSPESVGTESLLSTSGIPSPGGPFSKANDFTTTANTRAVTGMPSTFSTYNISRTYTLKVSFSILAANKRTSIEKSFPIVVYPPLESEPDRYDVAGPSSHPEVDKALPAYDRPPEYDEDAL